jgi:catalase-peroxidase
VVPVHRLAYSFGWDPSGKQRLSAEELLVDRAQLLTLTAPEITVPVGGLRVRRQTDGIS